MANKIPLFHLLDWKSIFGIFVVVLIIAGLVTFLVLPNLLRSSKIDRYQGEAVGYITSIRENTSIHHSRTGSWLAIDSYVVTYHYVVDSIPYSGTNTLAGNRKYGYHLAKAESSHFKESFKVAYDLKDPHRSLLNFD